MADTIVTPEQAIQRARNKVDEAIERMAELAMNSMKNLTPVLTGRLKRSWHQEDNNDGGIDVLNEQPYVKVIEYGQKAKERKLYKRGKKQGQIRKMARAYVEPHYMVTRTTNNAKRLAEIVARELREK